VFLGSSDSRANEDGAAFFVEQIWPKILKAVPHAIFEVVTRNATQLQNAIGNGPSVRVTGSDSDIRPHLADATVVVMPVLVGAGVRTRIFEAMASAKPVVSTSLGAEGISAENGKHLLIADWSQTFADAVIKLLEDASFRRQIGQSARDFVVSRYRAEIVASDFERTCLNVIASG
jgi:glycosyltransferase involved in cell wall biosynthesis